MNIAERSPGPSEELKDMKGNGLLTPKGFIHSQGQYAQESDNDFSLSIGMGPKHDADLIRYQPELILPYYTKRNIAC
jgi:hypothetical protein